MTLYDIIVLVNLATPVVVFLVSLGLQAAYNRMDKDMQTKVRDVASLVVPALEQTAAGLANEQKKTEAVKQIVVILLGLGYKSVPLALVETAVEAAVYAMKRARLPVQK